MLFRRGLLALALMIAAAIQSPGLARADDVVSARKHYEKGSALFDLQRYAEAAEEYEAAYQSKRDPALLFNLGQAYRLANNYSKATWAYKLYLQRVPKSPQRPELEKRIAELDRLEAERVAAAAQQRTDNAAQPALAAPAPQPVVVVQPAPAPVPASSRKLKIAGLAAMGAGLLFLAPGIALPIVAQQKYDTLVDPTREGKPPFIQADFDSDKSAIRTFEITGGVLIGVGVAAIIGGVTAYLIGWNQGRVRR